ncbi:hypothetical protein [Yinghuangia soli]|uniref:Uncharacterized protein n=1 Tax=Yinghuangia soli TaxID=2908204 RepID=A0AA41U870_9ACTN|nr:hypothetical protein [Yinghuangia soli]MCF2532604.1 hypothetical protein [Yinghuangia soli]
MGSERITIVLTGDEALVLADWLRGTPADDAAVHVPVGHVLEAVERRLGGPDDPAHADRLGEARQRLSGSR